MRSSRPFWCLAILHELPECFSEQGIMLAAGIPEGQEPNAGKLHFLLLCRTTAGTESEAHEFVRNALGKLGVTSRARIETLAMDLSEASPSERKTVENLEEEAVSLKSTFIAFKADSEGAV